VTSASEGQRSIHAPRAAMSYGASKRCVL